MIGVIIPDRGDRPKFLENCLRMLKAQTMQPTIIEIVNDAPFSDEKDITLRYRLGYERLRNKEIEVIALIENDDWYAPDYLEIMYNKFSIFQISARVLRGPCLAAGRRASGLSHFRRAG